MIYILSAIEACQTYRPWHDKTSHQAILKSDRGKCLHYYFYFNDPDLGFGYMRVTTWFPFQFQVYFNGHNVLANQLERKKIGFSMIDNAFDYIEDFEKAQKKADSFYPGKLLKKLNWLLGIYCPVHREFGETYHWRTMQQEYATDRIFEIQVQY
ncbi:MAG: hypothetical protein JWP81_2560 [Ferruginibacter sp.]|nr:hypothetical protein [Ferruginibacter sp.]